MEFDLRAATAVNLEAAPEKNYEYAQHKTQKGYGDEEASGETGSLSSVFLKLYSGEMWLPADT